MFYMLTETQTIEGGKKDVSSLARQVYNLFQNLWNKFLGFSRKVL